MAVGLNRVELSIIGKLITPHKTIENISAQAVGGKEFTGIAELVSKLAEGLKSLDGFSHMTLLFHLHKINGKSLTFKTFFAKVDNVPSVISGWLESMDNDVAETIRSDDRFV